MSLTLIFEAHGTTFDNEAHLSSGWNDIAFCAQTSSRVIGGIFVLTGRTQRSITV